METSINLRINAGQAKSEAESVRQSVENIIESLEKLKGEGNWSGAADLVRKFQEGQSASLQQAAPYSAGGSAAGYAGAGGTAQAIKSLEMRIEALTRVSEELAQQLEKAAEGGDYRASFNISAALNNIDQERQQLQKEKARLESPPKPQDTDNRQGKGGMQPISVLQSLMNWALQGASINSSYRQSMAQGDYIGAHLQRNEGFANLLGQISGTAMSAGLMTGFLPLTALGGIGSLGSFVWKLFNKEEQAEMAEAQAFQRSLEPTHGLNRLFFNGGYAQNNARAAALIGQGSSAARGTGLDLYEFLQLATGQAAYGAGSAAEAMAQTRQAALFANRTGADIGGALSFLGTMRRFGDTDNVLEIANYARGATGMTKAQTDEFLSSMSRIIEEGISNGFIRSTKDVAATMRMFYRLSDENPLWQGKYGAERLSRINAGIEGATALSKASDVIAYGAAQAVLEGAKSPEKIRELLGGNAATGTWVDYMMVLENGMSPDLFRQLARDINAIEGEGNVEAQIARWKDLTGVNSWGMAAQLYGMAQKYLAGGATEDEIKDLMQKYEESPREGNYESYLTAMQKSLNALAAGIAVMSEDKFRQMLETLHKQEGETRKEPQTVAEKVIEVGQSIIEVGKGIVEESASFAVETADLTNLGNAENYSRFGWNELAISTYLLARPVSDAAGEWNDVLRGGQRGKQKQMRDEAMAAIIAAATAEESPGGRIITAEELIQAFQSLNATKGAEAFVNANQRAFSAALKEALENLYVETQ